MYCNHVIWLLAGKGTYNWKVTGAIYDGDWKKDKRYGFGTYSVKKEGGDYVKQYAGGWKNNMRHVSVDPDNVSPL